MLLFFSCRYRGVINVNVETALYSLWQKQSNLCRKEEARRKLLCYLMFLGKPRKDIYLLFRNGGSIVKSLGRKTVLSDMQEKELVNILFDMEARLYGLTPMRIWYYVYQYEYCEANSIQHPFNRDKLRADWHWLKDFLIGILYWPLGVHKALQFREPKGSIGLKSISSLKICTMFFFLWREW